MALKFQAIAIRIAREKAVQAFDFVAIPGHRKTARLDCPGRGPHIAHPEREMPPRLLLDVSPRDQMTIHRPDAIPCPRKIKAFGPGNFLELQNPAIERTRSNHIRDINSHVIDALDEPI